MVPFGTGTRPLTGVRQAPDRPEDQLALSPGWSHPCLSRCSIHSLLNYCLWEDLGPEVPDELAATRTRHLEAISSQRESKELYLPCLRLILKTLISLLCLTTVKNTFVHSFIQLIIPAVIFLRRICYVPGSGNIAASRRDKNLALLELLFW